MPFKPLAIRRNHHFLFVERSCKEFSIGVVKHLQQSGNDGTMIFETAELRWILAVNS
jgi:hypothetical protein